MRSWTDDWGRFIVAMPPIPHGVIVAQHSHATDHVTWLRVGMVGYWADGVCMGTREGPADIPIPAGVKHEFMSLEDGTELFCIHPKPPVILEENGF